MRKSSRCRAVLLKSKDLSARGVLVSGELAASVLYIGEGQGRLSALRLRKPFTMEFEAEGLVSETMAQIALRLQGADLRLINPRKISVLFDVEGELSCYDSEKLPTEVRIPENTPGLHARTESRSIPFLNAVCEKSVAINEQFVFPAEPVPERLCAEKARLSVTDCQLLGSKMIVKGSLALTVCALTEEGDRPLFADFEAPFSQIVDVGAERMEASRVRPEITGSYFDLVDTINGQKALDVEVTLFCSRSAARAGNQLCYRRLQQSDASGAQEPGAGASARSQRPDKETQRPRSRRPHGKLRGASADVSERVTPHGGGAGSSARRWPWIFYIAMTRGSSPPAGEP